MINKIKKKIMNAKISTRLTIAYSLMICLLLIILSLIVIFVEYFYIDNQNRKILFSSRDTIVTKIENGADINDKNLLDDYAFYDNIFFLVFDKSGKVIGNSYGSLNNKLLQFDHLKQSGKIYKDIESENNEAAYLNTKIKIDGKDYILQVIKPLQNEMNTVTISIIALLIINVIGIILSVLIGRTMSKRMLKPISDINEKLGHIQITDLAKRLDISESNDEITNLSRTINELLNRLEKAIKKQTQFISDASHELKTPITVILSYAQMLKRWAKDDKEALETSIDNIELESKNMAALVERLLELARSEKSDFEINNSEFNINELINEIADETRLITKDNKKIIFNSDENIVIVSDRKLLKQLIRIFIDNSIKFTNENGKIEIGCNEYANHLQISIKDNGIGIPKEDIENIYDRFYCSDSSRNKDKSGYGLGLSIAQNLAIKLGFEIGVKSEIGRFTTFVLSKKL